METNILHTIKRRKANLIGHLLCRNCVIKHITEGKIGGGIEMMGRQGGIRKQLLDERKKTRGYCKLEKEAPDGTVWRTRFGRGCGPVVRQTVE
jgi:hypothetical protein